MLAGIASVLSRLFFKMKNLAKTHLLSDAILLKDGIAIYQYSFLTDHASVLALKSGLTSDHVERKSSEFLYFSSEASSSHSE
jgi:hypothetical protein